MKRAFTLIELLVVIAIIAILAAILFPVFAQAKLAAKKTKSLNNCKQMGIALQTYVTDYDDITPSIWGTTNSAQCAATLDPGQGCSNEWWMPLFPYYKTIDLIYSDERNDPDNNAVRRKFGATRLSAYGYNWGPFGWRGGGMLEKQVALTPAGNVNRGKSMTSFDAPAGTAAFGDTYDTPRATMGIGFSADTYNGNTNSGLRYSGMFNYVFVDGHAKAHKVRGGYLPGAFNNRWIMVADAELGKTIYCSNPDTILPDEDGTTSQLNTTPEPPGSLTCGQVHNWFRTTITTPCPATPSSACYWSN